MTVRVVKVKRQEKLGLVERLYVPMIVKGLWVTSAHFFRNLAGFITGKREHSFVVEYPEERVDYPDAFRGMPVLVQLDNGQPRCVACGLCPQGCPSNCIRLVPGEGENGNRYPLIYEIDEFRCVFCGYCQEVCPEEAIHVGVHYENSEYSRAGFVYDLERLMKQTHDVSTLWDPADPKGQ